MIKWSTLDPGGVYLHFFPPVIILDIELPPSPGLK